MQLLFWDLPFTCIVSLVELLGKRLASDMVGKATTVWISSLNANSLFVLLLEHLSSYLLYVKASEG